MRRAESGRGNVCVIRNSYVPLDTRVRREVEALAAAGYAVDVLCLAHAGEQWYERAGRVTYRRVQLPRLRGGAAQYLVEYIAFFVIAFAVAAVLHLRRRFDVIQVNSLPDFLVFSALVPRLLGARVLLDLHEPMPEFFATKFQKPAAHPAVRLVAFIEQASIRFADHAITCTDPMREAFLDRGAAPHKLDVVLNGSDEAVFSPERHPPLCRQSGRFVLISHGSVEERYGLDTIIRAVALLKDDIPELRLLIYGDGSYLKALRQLAQQLHVDDAVYFSNGYVPLDQLVEAIAIADLGVVAMKRDAFRDLTLCNKMYDFVMMRRPAIVSRTRSVEAYFGDGCFETFESGDEYDLARAIRVLYADPSRGEQLVQAAARAVEGHRWPRQRERYLSIVDRLVAS